MVICNLAILQTKHKLNRISQVATSATALRGIMSWPLGQPGPDGSPATLLPILNAPANFRLHFGSINRGSCKLTRDRNVGASAHQMYPYYGMLRGPYLNTATKLFRD